MRLPARFESGVWQLHSFRLLLSASMISIFGSLITNTAFPFIAIVELGAGPLQLAILGLAGIVPSALLGSLIGVWIDRRSPRAVMIGSDILNAIALATIPICWWLDALSMAVLFVVAFITSLAKLAFRVADRSLLPVAVGRDYVEPANAALSGGSAIAEAGGFSVGGLLVQVLTGPVALLFDAISFVASAFLLSRLQITKASSVDEEAQEPLHWRLEMIDGFRKIRSSLTLWPLAIALVLMSAGMQAIGTVYFLFVNQSLGFGPGVLGVVFAMGGIGSLIGATWSMRATARFGAGVALIGSLLVLSGAMGSITLARTARPLALGIMIGQQFCDAFWLYFESTSTSIRQLHAPEAMLGRINGAFENLEFIGLLIGAGLGALIGERIGLRATILTGAGLVVLAALSLLLSPVRTVRGLRPVDVGAELAL